MTIPKHEIEEKIVETIDSKSPGALLRPSYIEMDTTALRHNIRYIKSLLNPDTRFMAVVKANAYGHGAVEVSRIAIEEGTDFLGVAFLEEALELQSNFRDANIVLLYPENIARSIEAASRGIYITIASFDDFQKLSAHFGRAGKQFKFFIKAETGMNRYGMPIAEIEKHIREMVSGSVGEFIGISTNLADSNGKNAKLAKEQVENFLNIAAEIKKIAPDNFYHSFESSGSLWKTKNTRGTLARIGHLLYGLAPAEGSAGELRPVMSVKSRIAQIHDVKKGQGIGYGFTFVAKHDSKIAVIPMGYADGYPWVVSNKAQVLINGRRIPVVGRICMDAFMIDITAMPDCRENDEVTIMGYSENDSITAHELAGWANSFSYEILSRWSRRLPRIYR